MRFQIRNDSKISASCDTRPDAPAPFSFGDADEKLSKSSSECRVSEGVVAFEREHILNVKIRGAVNRNRNSK